MEIEVNTIKEIYIGHYQVILDFPEPKDLLKIIEPSYKYIWGFEHNENSIEWAEYTHSIFGKPCNENFRVRNINMEYLIETHSFLELIPFIRNGVKLIQTNITPPHYLNMDRLKGKGRYDLLKSRIDYLFEICMPMAIDYAPIVSPNLTFLENVIKKMTVS